MDITLPQVNAQVNTISQTKDPLKSYPLKLLPYSKSVGVLVSYVSPRIGNMFWVPTFMYYGADIYDRYKNDRENNFNPSASRGVRRVIFQGLTNLMFPLVATFAGNKMVSMLSLLKKGRLTVETKEALLKHHLTYATHCDSVNIFAEYPQDYKTVYNSILGKHIDNNMVKFSNNPIFYLKRFFVSDNKKMYEDKKQNMFNYINRNIDEMFEDYGVLKRGEKPKHFSRSMFNRFLKLKKQYAKVYEGNGENSLYAINDILKEVQERKLYRLNFAKMLGGMVLMLVFTKPVNDFVKSYLMNKYIDKEVDKYMQDNNLQDKISLKFLKK